MLFKSNKPISAQNESRGGLLVHRRGSALLLVLWIIGLLGMIVVSFAFDAHLESKVLTFSRNRIKCAALSDSGIELAKMLLKKSLSVTGNEEESDKEEDRWYEPALQLKNGRSVTLEVPLGDGVVRLDIEPEAVRRNLNKLDEEDWERILANIGMPEDKWPELIDSYFDWIDADDDSREDGAETDDYYSKLEKPYSAKNGPFETVRELLLVKGFSKAVLEGGVLNPEAPKEDWIIITNGVERLFTTYGDGKVNVNAVRADDINTLMSLPGVTEEGAYAILEEREQPASRNASDEDEDPSFKSTQDFMARVGDLLDDNRISNSISVRSEYFRITSVGQIDRVSRRISAIVYTDGKIWRVLRWCEEL